MSTAIKNVDRVDKVKDELEDGSKGVAQDIHIVLGHAGHVDAAGADDVNGVLLAQGFHLLRC